MDIRKQKFLTDDQRRQMYTIFQITEERRKFMREIESSMHKEIDPYIEKSEQTCPHCHQIFRGKEYGAHFRNERGCKYLKDRPFIKTKPDNWKADLELFEKQRQENP